MHTSPRCRGQKPNQLPGNLQHLYGRFMCHTFHLDIDNLTVASAAMTMSANHNSGGGPRHTPATASGSRTTSKYNRNLPQRVPHRKCHKTHQVATRATSARLCEMGLWSGATEQCEGGAGVRASIIHHKHFYVRSHLAQLVPRLCFVVVLVTAGSKNR